MQRNRVKPKIQEILRIQPSLVEPQRNLEQRMAEAPQRNLARLKHREIPRIQLSLVVLQKRNLEQRMVETPQRNRVKP